MSKLLLTCALLGGCAGLDDSDTSSETSAITQVVRHLVVRTVDASGAPYIPMVGEEIIPQIEFDTAATTPEMEIDFHIANQVIPTTFPASGPGHYIWGPSDGLRLSLDGSIGVLAVVGVNNEINGNPPTANNGRISMQTFRPATPPNEVDYFDEVRLTGYQTGTLHTTPGTRFLYMAAATTGADGQSTNSDTLTVSDANGSTVSSTPTPDANTNRYPVWIYDGGAPTNTLTLTQTFDVMVHNQRVDVDKLRAITWNDYANDIANNSVHAYYTQPEAVVQSTDPRIADFITATLGADYKANYMPYDAARIMFQTIVGRSSYVLPPAEGEVDHRAQSAVDMLLHPEGDCGSFTMLITATFRAMGLPARSTAGAWVGDDAGHAWTELLIPGVNEWIIADGAMANGMDPTGNFAYYFGAAVDRNQRMTQSRGNTFTAPGTSDTDHWLQGPALFMTAGSITSQTWKTHVQTSLIVWHLP